MSGRTWVSFLRRVDDRLFPRASRDRALIGTWILPSCRSVLDVGCGDQGTLVKAVPGIPHVVGVDTSVPPAGSASDLHSEYKEMDIRSLADGFDPASFDCVVALDVIEHLPRDAGFRLLDAMESIARKRVIILTPNGFLPQPPAPDNPFQEHVSGWTAGDFEARGYRVVGVNGWRPLRGPYAEVRWRPAFLWSRVSGFTQRFVESRPRWAFHLLCCKELAPG